MPILHVVKEPDQRLREKSAPIAEVNNEIKQLAYDMLETMYHEGGIGIAAIQVGRPLRMFILDVPIPQEGSEEVTRSPYVVINPTITPLSNEKIVLTEGCLSVRGEDGESFIRGDVERYLSIRLEFTDLNGKPQILEFRGDQSDYDKWSARCTQHEYGHLEGELFTDILVNPLGNNVAIINVTDA